MSRNGKQKGKLYGITQSQVERLVACLEVGCTDDEVAMRVRQIRVPFDTWRRSIPEKHISQILRVRATHGGRKIEASVVSS